MILRWVLWVMRIREYTSMKAVWEHRVQEALPVSFDLMSRQCPWVHCPYGQRTRLLISNSILWNFPHCTWGQRTTHHLYESGQLTFYSSFTAQHRMYFKNLQSQRCLLLYYVNSYVAIFYCWWRQRHRAKKRLNIGLIHLQFLVTWQIWKRRSKSAACVQT